jgi:hypothetical protein
MATLLTPLPTSSPLRPSTSVSTTLGDIFVKVTNLIAPQESSSFHISRLDELATVPLLHPYARKRVFPLRSEVPSSRLPIWWQHNLSQNFSTELQFYPSWQPQKSAELSYTASSAWNHAKPSCFTKGGQLSHQQPSHASPTPQKISVLF